MTIQNLLFTDGNGTLYVTNGGTVVTLASGTSTPIFSSDPFYGNISGTVLGADAYLILADSTDTTSAIWQYDGTLATQITPSTDYIFNGQDYYTTLNPDPIATYNGDLVFGEATLASNSAGDGNFDTTTLAIYDPTTQQTTQPTAPNGGYDPHDFVTLNGTLYFEATDSTTHQQAIYSYDGTSAIEIYNQFPTYHNAIYNANYPAAGGVQGSLIAFNGNLYFGSGQQSVYELTSLASLSNSATDVAGSAEYSSGTQPATNLIVANNHLFFLSNNNGIYSLDTSNGLTQVLGSAGAQSFTPVVYNGTLYFTASDPNALTPNLYTSTGGAASVVVSGASLSGFVQAGPLLYDNDGSAGLGTFDGISTGSVAVPGDNGGTPLMAVPFIASGWSESVLLTPPSVTAGGIASFTGGGSPVALDSALTVTDASSATLAGATISIGTGFAAGDTLGFSAQNGISGSYNAATGVLTLSGTASLAAYQTALDSITFGFSPANGDPTASGTDTSRTISWTVTDGTNSSTPVTSTLTVAHAAPVVTTDSGSAIFTGGGSAVVLDAGISVTDADSGGTLLYATVSVSSGFVSGDTLNFTNQNGITGNYNPSTGVLTLAGAASIAQYATALESVTYSTTPSNLDPTVAGTHPTRTISWTANDGVATSNTGTRTLNVLHAAPTVTAGATATFTVGGSAATLDGALAVTDPDSGGILNSGTVTISSGFLGGDILAFTNQNGITGSYNALNGVLTLSGAATLANYQTALESVAYQASGDPTNAGTDMSRTINWSVFDGVDSSGAATSTLNLIARPQITAGATATFSGGGSAVALDSGLLLTDPSSATLAGATVAISAGFLSGDVLNFTGQSGIIGSYNASNGVLTLSGSASLANYQSAFESVSYSFNPANGDPTGGGSDTSRTISWTATDGTNASTAVTSTLNTVHVAPTVVAGATAAYASSGLPSTLDPTLTVSDIDSGGTLVGATITIGSGFLAGDQIGFTDQNGITGNYNGITGVLTLSGSASVADYQTALRSVGYDFIGDPTNHGADISRTINWTVTDGTASSSVASSTLNVSLTPPVIAGTVGAQTTTDAASVHPFTDVSITDVNSGATETVTVTLSAAANGTLTTSGAGSYDAETGIYTVSGSATQVTSALDALLFTPTAHQVAPGSPVTTTFTIGVTDTIGATATDSTTTVAATAATDLPVISGATAGLTATDGETVSPFADISISDVDFGQTETVTVSLSSPLNGILSNLGGGSYDAETGVYTITGSDAAVTAAVDGLVFTPTAHQVVPGDTVTTTFAIGVTDTAGATATDNTTTVAATAATDLPVISGATAGQTTTDEASASPFAGISISDVDFGQTETVTVSLSNPLNGTLSNLGDGSYDAETGVYTIIGSDAAVTTAVDGLVFNPTAHQVAPGDTVTTTFAINVVDTAGATATDSTTTVAATAATDLPVISGATAGQTTTDEASASPFAGVSISDADFGQTETVTVTLSSPLNGILSNLGDGSYDAETGVYTITGSDAAVTAAVDGLVFTPTAHQVAPGDTVTTTFAINATDTAGATTTDCTTTVTATAVNDPPSIILNGVNAGVPDQVVGTPFSGLSITDPDIGHTDTVTVQLSDPAGGILSNLGGGTFDAATGLYTVTGSADAVTTALQGLVFTPAPPASGNYVRTTNFAVEVTGPGGTASNNSISVTSAQQVLGLAGNAADDDVVTPSPDGSGLPAPVAGKSNQVVITAPTQNGSYSLPAGYQAIFAGGTVDLTLSDPSGGHALLVGNSGNDTISAQGDDDTLIGGSGVNTFNAGGRNDIIGTNGTATVNLSGLSDIVYAGAGPLTLTDSGTGNQIGLGIGSSSITLTGTSTAVYGGSGGIDLVDQGAGDEISGSSGPLSAMLTGSDTRVFGGSGTLSVTVANTATDAVIGTGVGDATIIVDGTNATIYGGSGTLTASITGTGDKVGLSTGSASLTLSGNGTQVFGGSGSLTVDDEGTNDTISAGSGFTSVSGNGSGLIVAGGGGTLQFIGGSHSATIYGGSGTTNVTGGAGATLLYGGAGGTITFSGSGGAATYQAGSGNETLDASASTTNNVLNGGIDPAGSDVLIGGSGNDRLYAGTGNDTFTGGAGSDQFVFYKAVIAGTAPSDVITDFSATDQVILAGYGSNEAVSDLATASSSNGNTTITLSDNTRITFQGIGSASGLLHHVIST